MASLTESSLIFGMINNDTDSNNSKKWYDRVYLCSEDTKLNYPNRFGTIKGFNCYKYNSFENANTACNKYNNLNLRFTIIPICKWVPHLFDKYILDWKLKKIYWLGKNTIVNSYNGYKFKKF